VHADNFIINHCATGQTIEGIAKLLPHLDGEATATLVVESINPIDTRTLVIAPQEKEVFWILNFVCK
jgi:hypothetical protein